MQQTEKYHFNIIDPSDDFSPEKLNENARKLETALLDHKAETDTTLSRHKSETDAALARQAETVVQCREENCLFKLGGPTMLAGRGGDIIFSLSGVDMSQYAALLLVHTVNFAELSSVLYLDNTEIATAVITNGYNFGAVACTMIIHQPVRNCVGAMTFFLDGLNDNARPTLRGSAVEGVAWVGASSVKLTKADFAVLYGLKK